MATVMASAYASPTSLSSSSPNIKSALSSLSASVASHPKAPKFGLSILVPELGLGLLGVKTTRKSLRIEKRRRCKGKAVYASLFGVGAPEALVIGVVALLVFGPKGLAEVARNLGKTLRAFQPTIRELQDVSREFKSTLEREIGIDDINSSTQSTYRSIDTSTNSTQSSTPSTADSQTAVDPNGASSPKRGYSSEEYLKITEEQLKASATKQQGQMPPLESQAKPPTLPQAAVQKAAAAAATTPLPQNPKSET